MKDRWQCYANAAAITPSDTAIISPTPLALSINAGGGATGIKVDTLGGQLGITIPLTPSTNQVYPLMVTRVYATGTVLGTGGTVVALW